MMGGDDDDSDTIVETQEISSENLFHPTPAPQSTGYNSEPKSPKLSS